MAEEAPFTKARLELEALYEGVPDESVNLTFRHLTDDKLPPPDSSSEKEKIKSSIRKDVRSTELNKLPSLDFNRGLQAANQHFRPESRIRLHPSAHVVGVHATLGGGGNDIDSKSEHPAENSVAYGYDDGSRISVHHRGRRPGIPHSNICTICTTYIYIFRHRCLVCGRVYCRQCVRIGMGEMTEGRKCVECLGRRFSHRYIARAGDIGWCGWRYPRMVKLAELKWAERGPRRKSERPMTSTISPWSRSANNVHSSISSPRFAVMPYSPPHRHHIPF